MPAFTKYYNCATFCPILLPIYPPLDSHQEIIPGRSIHDLRHPDIQPRPLIFEENEDSRELAAILDFLKWDESQQILRAKYPFRHVQSPFTSITGD